MSVYSTRPLTLGAVHTYPLASRKSKVNVRDFAKAPATNASLGKFLDSLPDILAASDLRKVLDSAGAGVSPITAELLAKTVELLRGQSAETAVQGLAEVAVARRGEVVARVSAATELSDAQQTRLTEVLSRIYGHPVTSQIQIDPELLGGLAITVGDEIIDGTLSSRLAAAQSQLPD